MHDVTFSGAWLASSPVALPDDWLNYVNAPQTEAELKRLRLSVRRDAPYGNDEWGGANGGGVGPGVQPAAARPAAAATAAGGVVGRNAVFVKEFTMSQVRPLFSPPGPTPPFSEQ
jgi:hypothetical protein